MTNHILPVITEHGGRIVKHMGHGFLTEFASAVDAVSAAMQFQAKSYLTGRERSCRGMRLAGVPEG